MTEQSGAQVLIIDDDLLIRELIELMLLRRGYEVYQAASGEEALALLETRDLSSPSTILADMQLPGISGTSLAHRLRTWVGSGTRIVAISGDQPLKAELEGFDGFMRKPFDEDALNNVLHANVPSSGVGDGDRPAVSPLDARVYDRLASSMSQEQLTQLYELCVDDCRVRIGMIGKAAGQNNVDVCRKEAHTIKGSCGMVGATEIASIAEFMEGHGLVVNIEDSLDEMTLACRRLEDQLRARGLNIQPEDHQKARRTAV